MTFDLHIQIDDQSPEGQALVSIVSRDRVSPEEAVKLILKDFATQSDPDNFDHLFTPAAVADLRSISAAIKAGGKTYTMDEVDQHFIQKRKPENLPLSI
jgi:hypothetical protein